MAQVNDIGIDLGTSNVLIYMKGKGIVLREPAVVAIDRDTRNAIAVGNDAYRMIGRTPGSVLAIRPLQNGSMVDFELLKTMLLYFLNKVVGKRLFARPRAVISVPTGVNSVEKRSINSVMFDAGIRRTQVIERPIAAALGVGIINHGENVHQNRSHGRAHKDKGHTAADGGIHPVAQSAKEGQQHQRKNIIRGHDEAGNRFIEVKGLLEDEGNDVVVHLPEGTDGQKRKTDENRAGIVEFHASSPLLYLEYLM